MKNKLVRITLAVLVLVLVSGIVAFAATSNTSKDSNKRKIGYILTGSMNEPGWNGMNYAGIEAACENLDIELLVKENYQNNIKATQ